MRYYIFYVFAVFVNIDWMYEINLSISIIVQFNPVSIFAEVDSEYPFSDIVIKQNIKVALVITIEDALFIKLVTKNYFDSCVCLYFSRSRQYLD